MVAMKMRPYDEDVEELFEDDGREDGRGRGSEIGGVGEDTHDVADAEGQDVVGGQRGHQDAGADLKAGAAGAHHAGPAKAAQGVAGEGEAEDTGDPDWVLEAERAELGGVDSTEGIPEEEGADEKARDGFDEITAAGLGRLLGHRGVENRPAWNRKCKYRSVLL
ncbi:MAG: hypothetical protein PW789_12495 [Edaphobacter sp.]|nr:hypothetical protein [Edaphobacter sp.]MDE1177403.1 hypothetical protein [Edaphobacter sp.]